MKKKMTMLALTLTAALALTACGNQPASAAQTSATPTAAPTAAPTETPAAAQTAAAGTVLLSVNPEIEMDYDDGGRVLALRACNADGQAVLNGYDGYAGRPCPEVANWSAGSTPAAILTRRSAGRRKTSCSS